MDKEQRIEDSLIRIADKPIGAYLTAVAIKLETYDRIEMTAFGRNLGTIWELIEKVPRLFPVVVTEVRSLTQKNTQGIEHKGIKAILTKEGNKDSK